MLTAKKPTLGAVTQSRTAITLFAATLLAGGGITEASAKSRYHRHHHHSHHASDSNGGGSWRNALSRFGAGPDAAALPRSLHAELAALGRHGEDVATAEDGVRCHAALEALRASAAASGVWVEVE